MSYDQVAAQDAIVGVYPVNTNGAEKEIAALTAEDNAAAPPHLAMRHLKLSAVDGLFLKAADRLSP
jgi:hypothetical protein